MNRRRRWKRTRWDCLDSIMGLEKGRTNEKKKGRFDRSQHYKVRWSSDKVNEWSHCTVKDFVECLAVGGCKLTQRIQPHMNKRFFSNRYHPKLGLSTQKKIWMRKKRKERKDFSISRFVFTFKWRNKPEKPIATNF